MAWFATAPKPLNPKVQKQPVTRGQQITDNGGALLFPEVDEAVQYLLAYWYDLGCALQGGVSGVVPLTATEVQAWQQGTAVQLNPYEFRVVLALSRAYVAELQAAEKPDCPPPYGNPVNEFDRTLVSKKLAQAFAALQQGKKHEHRKTHN